MREIVAVCRSSKKARLRTARVLDRYFWRIGERTWRGRATNACLDRVARELREIATRNTSVMIQEVRTSKASRVPLILVGSRRLFSADGLVPVASHPARFRGGAALPEAALSFRAVVQIAALFHDLGKATRLFQGKLARALRDESPVADAVRHELVSAFVWDELVGGCDDAALIVRLRDLTPAMIDAALEAVAGPLTDLHARAASGSAVRLELRAARAPEGLAFQIGALVLDHHRLPETDTAFESLLAARHITPASPLLRAALAAEPGVPFWHAAWWLEALGRAAAALRPGLGAQGLDMKLRAALMFADHLGSSRSVARPAVPPEEHLANTRDGKPADSLAVHVRKVHEETRGAFDMLHRARDRFPALLESEVPLTIACPEPGEDRFRWQAEAALAARELCASATGGFFGCILAGTGTGKTRGAPTLLAAAAFHDALPERRGLRLTLGLGLRSLATQSGAEYVGDIGFAERAVAVLVGQPPVRFLLQDPDEDHTGSESRIALPDWLRIERARGGVPAPGSQEEADWLRTLSLDTDRQLPAFCARAIEAAGRHAHVFRQLVETPVLVATVDHVMGVAAPLNSRFLPQALRVLTADLILDEIDQYGPEDLAALCRLAYQVGAGGRRLIIMSATLPEDVAARFFTAYRAGWRAYAQAEGAADAVNLLCTGDAASSCACAAGAEEISPVFARSRAAMLAALYRAPPLRRGRILPSCAGWDELVRQIDAECHTLHDATAVRIGAFRVSAGLVRMTRISHTAALAAQLPAGGGQGRLRLKLCLHARFPRLHRTWMEKQLKSALTRKHATANAGLEALCRDFGVFDRAARAAVTEIELVIVASPVIETGNDLDFDYAVLDPSSLRAVVQAAGRVNRHRVRAVEAPNVALLGRSPIVMQAGRLAMPGVETPPHRDTRVGRVTLEDCPARLAEDLIGAAAVSVISARVVLAEEPELPLRAAEARLRRAMLEGEDGFDPCGRYLASPLARLSATMPRLRAFRRSTTKDVVYALSGETLEEAAWHADRAPGTPESRFLAADVAGGVGEAGFAEEFLLRDVIRQAWRDLEGDDAEMTAANMRRLLRIDVPDYGDSAHDLAPVCYAEQTGMTWGSADDLFGPFGKT